MIPLGILRNGFRILVNGTTDNRRRQPPLWNLSW